MERLSAEDQVMLWPDSLWPQEIGAVGILDGACLLDPDGRGRIEAVHPELVVTGNPGCHSWIEAGLRARGSQVPVKHTIEVLAEAYGPG